MSMTLGVATPPAAPGKRPRRDAGIARLLDLITRLGEWAKPRAHLIYDIYVVPTGPSVVLRLVTHAEAYDFDLGRQLTDFAVPFIERGLVDSAFLLPAATLDELEAFFDPAAALRLSFR